ncbi:hypothetical protein OROMI_033501 [Orobanche minor]
MFGLSCRQRRQKRNSFDSTLVIQTFEAEAEIYSNSSFYSRYPTLNLRSIMPPIKLQTKDNVIMMVDEPAIVNYMINRRDPTPDGIFISDFRSEILFKVIKYIQFHAQSNSPGDMEVFDKEFVNEEQTVLFEIFVAGFVFKIKGLRDLTRPSFPLVAAAVELSALGVSESSQHPTTGDSSTTIGFQGDSSTTIGFERDFSKRSRASSFFSTKKRAYIDSPTDTRERVNGIDCIVREDDDVVEYIPYKGVYLKTNSVVAAAGEIPEEMKEEMKRRRRCAVTFSFPYVGMKIGKTARGELIEAESFVESEKQANKYYDEAFQKATESLSLGSSSSALRPCASGTRSSGTSSSQPMISSLGYSSSALRPCTSGTSSSQPMIE